MSNQVIDTSFEVKIPVGKWRLSEMTETSLDALYKANNPPRLLVRSGQLVRYRQDEKGSPLIEEVNDSILIGELDRIIFFYNTRDKKKLPVNPPLGLARDIRARGKWNFPSLTGIVECPVVRPDGTILTSEGYDQETGLIYHQSPRLGPIHIPDRPSPGDLAAAATLLKDLIVDFPFVDEASRVNMLALLITPIIRPALSSPVPLALIDATQAGTGKTLLSELPAIIATGKGPSFLQYSKDTAETRKQVTSLLQDSAPVILMDNIALEINSPVLASLLTSNEWGDRLLGRSEHVRLPNQSTWIANGNNLRLGGDMPRRCYVIKLDAKTSRPWTRDRFRHPNLVEWAHEHRAALLRAILILVRAWFASSCPNNSNRVIGSFGSWSRIVGGILEHAGFKEFLSNAEAVYEEADVEGTQWEIFLHSLLEHHGNTWSTSADIAGTIGKNPEIVEALPDELSSQLLPDGKITQRFKQALGQEFGKRSGTRYGTSQIYLVKEMNRSKKVAKWKVIRGDAGDNGDKILPF